MYISVSDRDPGPLESRRRDWDFSVIPSLAGITNFIGISDRDFLTAQKIIQNFFKLSPVKQVLGKKSLIHH